MRDNCSLHLWFFFQDEILAEELRKSEYSESASGSVFSSPEPLSVREPESFSFPVEKKSVSESTNDSGNLSDEASGPSAAQLLLDPPLTDEEISADLSAIINEASGLDELDMMIQSAGPFQHPRSVAQNYAHSNGNVYHRQPSYHHHPHHHQVSERINILRLSISMTNSSNKLNFSIKCLSRLIRLKGFARFLRRPNDNKWTQPSGFSHKIHLTRLFTTVPTSNLATCPYIFHLLDLGCDIDRLLSCFLVIAEIWKNWWHRTTYPIEICLTIPILLVNRVVVLFNHKYVSIFIWNMIGSFCLLVFRCATFLPAFKRTYPILPVHFFPFALFSFFFRSFILWRRHTLIYSPKKETKTSLYQQLVPSHYFSTSERKKNLTKNVKRKTTY